MRTTTIALIVLSAASAAVSLAAGSAKALGSPNAPITIDLFSDFQCPHCKELHDEVLPHLIADFVQTGKVYLVRHYYLLPRPYSRPAATYVCAAEKIGKYDPVADALWRTQMSWVQTGRIDDVVRSVLSPADMQKVRTLVKDPSVTSEVDQDTALGNSEHVNQTPTMIVVHKGRQIPISGFIDYSYIKMYLDGELKK